MIDIIIFILLLVAILLLGYGLFGIDITSSKSERYSERLNLVSGIKSNNTLLNRYFIEILKKEPKNSSSNNRKRNIEQALKKFSHNKKKKSLAERIESAGMKISAKRFVAISIALGVMIFMLMLFYLGSIILSICVALIGSFLLPELFLKSRIKAYQKAFLNNFIGALEIIIRGVQSGLPLSDCIAMLAKEGKYPIRQEFHLLIEEQKIGLNLQQSLKRMHERLPLAEVGFFCIVLNINSSSGGNISEPLMGLVDVLRGRNKLLQKVKSATAESKGSAMVLAAVPFVVGLSMYLLNPQYFIVMFETTIGISITIGTVVWMAIGGFIMKNMINFKY